MPLPDATTLPPWPPEREPSNAELAEWLHATSEENRAVWLKMVQDNQEQAQRCWLSNHEGTIAMLRSELANARARIDWLERNYHRKAAAS